MCKHANLYKQQRFLMRIPQIFIETLQTYEKITEPSANTFKTKKVLVLF